MTLVGILGNATKQSVSKSGDPSKWLQCRIRRAIVPERHTMYNCSGFQKLSKRNASRYLDKVARALSSIKLGKQYRSWSPKTLSSFLGVTPKPTSSLLDIFSIYLDKLLKTITSTMYGNGHVRVYKMTRILDKVIPRWVNRTYGVGTQKRIFGSPINRKDVARPPSDDWD
jgi:hypothetical protein